MGSSLHPMAAAVLLILSDCACAQSIISTTQVTWFAPSVPSGPIQEGSCWTRSIAGDRPGAWRCMIGNGIHDPCFQVAPMENEVICDANPVLGKSGFVMKLTTPLPLVTAPPTPRHHRGFLSSKMAPSASPSPEHARLSITSRRYGRASSRGCHPARVPTRSSLGFIQERYGPRSVTRSPHQLWEIL